MILGARNKKLGVGRKNTLGAVLWLRVFLTMAIIGLCIYSASKGPDSELLYQEVMFNPEKYENTEMFLSYAPVVEAGEGKIIVQQFDDLVPVITLAGVVVGDYFSFRGFLDEDSAIVASEYHVHAGRDEKYWLGLIPLGVIFFYFLKRKDLRNI